MTLAFRGSGLEVDVAPVIYEGDADDRGFLVAKHPGSAGPDHRQACTCGSCAAKAHGRARREPDYAQLIRLLKSVGQGAEATQGTDFRFKSFLVELIVAHLVDDGREGRLSTGGPAAALELFFAFSAVTPVRQRISFTDYYLRRTARPNGTRRWRSSTP